MIKVLLKKQMTEIFRSYVYDQKKNKARSKAAVAAYIVLFVVLMVGILGGMFLFLANAICRPLAEAGAGWLYFAIMSLIAIALGAFGSVFNTYSGLYLAKDNDLLLSMPIPPSKIMVARLLGVYLMGLMYSGIVMLPAIIVYFITVSAAPMAIIGGILLCFLISVFVLTLSAALGWVVAKISLKLKNKSFTAVFASLVFMGVYYFVYFKAQTVISDLVANAAAYGEKIKGSAYPIYMLGSAGTGDIFSLLAVTGFVAVLFALMWKLLSASFMKIATTTPKEKKKKYISKDMKRSGIGAALLGKELARFTGSPNYMLNCGLGILLLPVFGVFMAFKGESTLSVFAYALGLGRDAALFLPVAVVCFVCTMNDMAAPSVSLEGRTLWLLQSLPVTPWQVLKAKLSLQIMLTGVPAVICMLCLLVSVGFSAVEFLLSLLVVLLCICFLSLSSLFLGLKLPSLNWTSEITPVKQSAAVIFALLIGFLFAALIGVGGVLLMIFCHLGFAATTGIIAAAEILLSLPLYLWIKKGGSKAFAGL